MNITIQDGITPTLKKMQQQLDALPQKAYKEFVKNTPVRSGNARRRTKLRKSEIQADYVYAQRLDEGYSKQSPEGMVQPTEEFVIKEFNRIMAGK